MRWGARRSTEWLLASAAVLALAAPVPYAAARPVAAAATVGTALLGSPGVVPPVALPAHAQLVSAQPADGATLATGPAEIVLTFNEDVAPSFVQVALTREGASQPVAAPTVSGRVVRLTLTPPPAGSYQVAFRVVSADGHPISGQTRFTVTGPSASPTPGSAAPTTRGSGEAPAVTVPYTPSTARPTASTTTAATAIAGQLDDASALPWLLAGGLLVVGAGVGAWLGLRRRPST